MSHALQPMTEAEYLAWSERQELTYEFDGFQPIAMNGGTIGHERIRRNLASELELRLRGGPCEPFGPSTRVPTGQGRYRFPDALVTCTRLEASARDVAAPVVIFEVMSDSTSGIDRGEKLVEYRGIASLTRYVMLDQIAALATVITRTGAVWSIEVCRKDEVIVLPEIGIEVPLPAIYAGMIYPDPLQPGDRPR